MWWCLVPAWWVQRCWQLSFEHKGAGGLLPNHVPLVWQTSYNPAVGLNDFHPHTPVTNFVKKKKQSLISFCYLCLYCIILCGRDFLKLIWLGNCKMMPSCVALSSVIFPSVYIIAICSLRTFLFCLSTFIKKFQRQFTNQDRIWSFTLIKINNTQTRNEI